MGGGRALWWAAGAADVGAGATARGGVSGREGRVRMAMWILCKRGPARKGGWVDVSVCIKGFGVIASNVGAR